jgi:N-methylhydantoinase B/oxoprolinase/acetone carboxylase alpha subunit
MPYGDFRPYGLYGGGPGKPSMNYLNPNGENRPLPSKLTMTIRRGDFFRVRARRAPIVFGAGRRHWCNAGYALSSQNVSSRTMS